MRVVPQVRDIVVWREGYDHPSYEHWMPGRVTARVGHTLRVRCADDKIRDIPDSWLSVKKDALGRDR